MEKKGSSSQKSEKHTASYISHNATLFIYSLPYATENIKKLISQAK